MITITSYTSVDAFLSNGKWSEGDAIGSAIIFYFLLILSITLRIIARYLWAGVKWWDFIAFLLSMTLLEMLFGRFTYGTSFVSIYTLFPAVSALLLLVLTFRQPKTFIG